MAEKEGDNLGGPYSEICGAFSLLHTTDTIVQLLYKKAVLSQGGQRDVPL